MKALTTGLALWLCLSGTGCDTQGEQNDFVDAADQPPNGITRTDAGGQVLSEDQDDWRSAPVYIGKVRLDPAYPNPATTAFVTLQVNVLEFGGVRGGLFLRANNASGRFILLDDLPDASSPGFYSMTFSPAALGRTGLHRLFLFDSFNELVSYGDLEVP
jgi:hypothetical protein